MDKIKIAVGTTSEHKLGFLKEVLDELEITNFVEILPVKAPSEVSEQPITEEETKKGSINRAKSALKYAKGADFGLGVEAGYNKNKENKYEIFCYATIVGLEGNKTSSISHKFPLPRFHHEKVETGKYLGEHVKEYYQDTDHPVKNYLGKMIDSRKLIIQDAIRQVILIYLMREEF